jgi:hypothetical protein
MSKEKVNTLVSANVETKSVDNLPDNNSTISTEKINIANAEYAHGGLVNFFVEYVKGYNGPKHMEEGSIHKVDSSAADYFISKGMGKVIQ